MELGWECATRYKVSGHVVKNPLNSIAAPHLSSCVTRNISFMQYVSAVNQSTGSRQLALEADVLGNMVQSIAKFFPSVFKDFNEGASKYLSNISAWSFDSAKLQGFAKRELPYIKELSEVPFEEMENFKVPVPEGFKGALVPYSTLLIEDKDYFYETFVPALENFYVILSSVATNKDARMSLRDDVQAYKKLADMRTARDKAQQKFFGSTHDVAIKFPIAFQSNNDVSVYLTKLNELATHDHSQLIKLVKDKIISIGSVITALVDMAESGTIKNMTPEVVKSLHAGTYEMASQIEFFAIYIYRCSTLLSTREVFDTKLAARF